MKIVKKVLKTFVACDGKTFNSKEECEKHELMLQVCEKLNAIDITDNGFLYESFLDNYKTFYKAIKFSYKEGCSLSDIFSMVEDKHISINEPITTIFNEEQEEILLANFPPLKDGETYIVIHYQITIDWDNEIYEDKYFLANLAEYKYFRCRDVYAI